MQKITFQNWHTSCGDPSCCDEYGTNLFVNGELITNQASVNEEELKAILNELNVEFEIEILDSEN